MNNVQADYDALKEYLTAARGWDTYGLDVVYYDGWVIYCGSRPFYPLRPDGSFDDSDGVEVHIFESAAEAVSALRTFCKSPKAAEVFSDEDGDLE